jgi:hypothetical protein
LIVESGFKGVEGLLGKADDGPVSTSKHRLGITFLRAGGGGRRVWAADTPFYHEDRLLFRQAKAPAPPSGPPDGVR